MVSRRTRLAARLAAGLADWRRVVALLVVAFGVGLLVGWLVLGWWLAPPGGPPVTPARLDPAWRSLYVQTVAAAYIRENDLARARVRLQGFDDAALRGTLAELANDQAASAVSRYNVTALAGALSLALGGTPAPAGTVTAAAPSPGTATPGSGAAGVERWVILLVVGALLSAAGVWLWRMGSRGRAPGATAPVADGGAIDVAADVVPPRAAGRGRPATPPWRPGRLYLGDTITTRYRASDEPFYQSFLVHNDRGVLIGSVSMQSQRVGSVATVDVWLVERDDEGTDGETPLVTFAARAAAEDKVFRARLSDRRVIPAVPGERVLLEATHVVVDVRVRAAEPAPDSDVLGVDSLTLSLTPDRVAAPDTGPGSGADTEPPVPLPFRAD